MKHSILLLLLCLSCATPDYEKAILGTWELEYASDGMTLITQRTFSADGKVLTHFEGSAAEEAKKQGQFSRLFEDRTSSWAIKEGKLHIDPNGQNYELYQIMHINKKEMRLKNLFDALQREGVLKRKGSL